MVHFCLLSYIKSLRQSLDRFHTQVIISLYQVHLINFRYFDYEPNVWRYFLSTKPDEVMDNDCPPILHISTYG